MVAFSTTILILGLILLGVALGGRRLFPGEFAEKGALFAFFLLILLMGFSTSRVEDIALNWSALGTIALLSSVLPLLGTWLFQGLAGFLLHQKHPTPDNATNATNATEKQDVEPPCLACVFRLPFVLVSSSVLGFLLGWFTPLFDGVNIDPAVDLALFLLVFLVGYQLGYAQRRLRPLFLRWENLVLPLVTVVGSLVSALLLPHLTGLKLSESLALVSGMGWYSLGSVLLTGLGHPLLGSLAFMANLLREIIGLMVIPLLLRLRQRNMAIASPGAPSMDVALPLLGKFAGVDVVPLALAHGLVVTLLVPPLIFLWMGLGF